MKKMQFSEFVLWMLLTQAASQADAAGVGSQGAILGAAYQSGTDTYLASCMDFQPQFIVNPAGGFFSSSEPAVDKLMLGASFSNGAALRSLFNGENYSRRFQNLYLVQKDYSELFVTTFWYTAGQLVALNPAIKTDVANLTDPAQYYAECGNRFALSADVGGDIQLVTRIEFANAMEAGNISRVAPSADRTGHLSDELVAKMHDAGLDAAFVVAVGIADASKQHFFGYLSNHGFEPLLTLTCDAQTWSQCRNFLEVSNDYMTDGSGGYASQFLNISAETALAHGGESYRFSDYAVAMGSSLDLLSAVEQLSLLTSTATINFLADEYELKQGQRQRIAILLDMFDDRFDDARKSALIAIDATLQSEMELIGSVGIACLNGDMDCVSRADGLVLEDVDGDELELPYVDLPRDSAVADASASDNGGGSVGLPAVLLFLLSAYFRRLRLAGLRTIGCVVH